jgi:hypothetical protein
MGDYRKRKYGKKKLKVKDIEDRSLFKFPENGLYPLKKETKSP